MPPKVSYKQIRVNLTPENHEKMRVLSSQYDMSIASLFRELAQMQHVDAPARKGSFKSDNYTSHVPLYQVAKLGANLNMIANECNFNKLIDRLVLGELVKIRNELKKLLIPPPSESKNNEKS